MVEPRSDLGEWQAQYSKRGTVTQALAGGTPPHAKVDLTVRAARQSTDGGPEEGLGRFWDAEALKWDYAFTSQRNGSGGNGGKGSWATVVRGTLRHGRPKP